MDAKQWNGSDEREFGPDPDAGTCLHCGAREDERCTDECGCPTCCRESLRRCMEEAKQAEPQ
jgi:hypothetical protein